VEQKEIVYGKFAIHLGKRVQHVNIVNEKDCIKIIPKVWLDKQIWKEINDILRHINSHGYQTAKIAAG
jgi:hypothetical protein